MFKNNLYSILLIPALLSSNYLIKAMEDPNFGSTNAPMEVSELDVPLLEPDSPSTSQQVSNDLENYQIEAAEEPREDEGHNIGRENQIASLKELAAKFIASKLMNDIRNRQNYTEYLGCLNNEVKELVLKALLEEESVLLWKVLPCNIAVQNASEVFWIRKIIVLDNDRLLVFYQESHTIYRIKIWDMKSQEWVNNNFNLPEVRISNMLVAKDLKTLIIQCFDDRDYIIVYNLVDKEIVSKIVPDSKILSFTLAGQDQLICCTSYNGRVSVFDISTTKKVLSFETSLGDSGFLIDCIDDVIVVVSIDSGIVGWRLRCDQGSVWRANEIVRYIPSPNIVLRGALLIDKKNILIDFLHDYFTWHLYSFPDCKPVECNLLKAVKCRSINTDYMLNRRLSIAKDDQVKGYQVLALVDNKSGGIIKSFDLSNVNWRRVVVAISPDKSFIILWDKKCITRISLNLNESLDNILEKIKFFEEQKAKSHLEQEAESQSLCCLVS